MKIFEKPVRTTRKNRKDIEAWSTPSNAKQQNIYSCLSIQPDYQRGANAGLYNKFH